MVPIDQINALEEKNKELLNNLVSILKGPFFSTYANFSNFFAAAVEQLETQTLLYMIGERKF